MEILSVPFTLYSPDSTNFRTLNGVVDTGASFTIIPEAILDKLGIERGERFVFSLADGSLQELCVGYAEMELQGYSNTVTVVFGSDNRKILIRSGSSGRASSSR
jgi:predicted aspartyl protease